jgi:hypothetical protein
MIFLERAAAPDPVKLALAALLEAARASETLYTPETLAEMAAAGARESVLQEFAPIAWIKKKVMEYSVSMTVYKPGQDAGPDLSAKALETTKAAAASSPDKTMTAEEAKKTLDDITSAYSKYPEDARIAVEIDGVAGHVTKATLMKMIDLAVKMHTKGKE